LNPARSARESGISASTFIALVFKTQLRQGTGEEYTLEQSTLSIRIISELDEPEERLETSNAGTKVFSEGLGRKIRLEDLNR
jgi:hypothetical protein